MIKIKIDNGGFLSVERAEKLKPQYCPYQPNDFETLNEHKCCGDWCPAFGIKQYDASNFAVTLGCFSVTIRCSADDFLDERPKENA
jgi:hypothetical protein